MMVEMNKFLKKLFKFVNEDKVEDDECLKTYKLDPCEHITEYELNLKNYSLSKNFELIVLKAIDNYRLNLNKKLMLVDLQIQLYNIK